MLVTVLQESKVLHLLTSACRRRSGSYLLRDNLLSSNESSQWDEENDGPRWGKSKISVWGGSFCRAVCPHPAV